MEPCQHCHKSPCQCHKKLCKPEKAPPASVETVNVRCETTASKPQDVSMYRAYTFFIKMISGVNIDLVMQLSPDGKEWFIEGAFVSLNSTPYLFADRILVGATHYSHFARILFVPRGQACGELQIFFQGQPCGCI